MPETDDLAVVIEAATGSAVRRMARLTIGHNAELHRVLLADGRQLVAKCGNRLARLDIEAYMLRHLAAHSSLPVPAVHHASASLLLMDHIEGGGAIDRAAERHAADLIAALHEISAPAYGFPRSTLIGPLEQPNKSTDDWIAFFRDERLLRMAKAAQEEGRIGHDMRSRAARLAERLGELIPDPNPPALIHGDLWGGNILATDGRITGFIDPAIYHADPEIELAFTTLFGTFGPAFFDRYREHRPIKPGFFEVRRDLYNLYPLLVHVRLFGGAYVHQLDQMLRRFVG